ncbi:hypothetical protein ANO14919_123800 [Xylariales sp. No.14919]|nr:hypothetical protein ANO14919_123800 [Xylariales sp. No.14919]
MADGLPAYPASYELDKDSSSTARTHKQKTNYSISSAEYAKAN